MDKETAKKVLEIMAVAEVGCEFCVRRPYLRFIKGFPGYAHLARRAYRERVETWFITEDLVWHFNI